MSKSPFSFISLLTEKLQEIKEYGFRLKEFYSKLPEPVRPLPLSAYCKEKLSDGCQSEDQLSDFADMIKKALEFPDFVKVTKLLLIAFSSETKACDKFIEDLERFKTTAKVLSVTDLQVDVSLTLISPSPNIGTMKVDFLLQHETSGDCSLYIDKDAYALKINLFESLTSAIVSCVVGMNSSEVVKSKI